MLFKLDENLPASLVRVFELAGHDATSVPAQGLQGESDATVAQVCRQEGRALVTLDAGFADIRAYPPEEYAGIIVLRLRDQAVPYVRSVIDRVLLLMSNNPIDRTLWIVEDERVRFRQ